ncbi:nitroreductase family protein [Methanocorpusculum sp. MG]|uniref:Nitroreductase family protein n=1 Tax=Methanocorpusculum petauri TaxID=3002863 RepID=A0ABT4IHF8_9EURY|nr:nitroreductase family protein [Methanocorpusculum petauri]MCZ0861188.1 nitroreductase family protein [Methanocorpusculum petauri]MDE2442871.1 nitroreductase family protein [Methanocorpusculum sp.]
MNVRNPGIANFGITVIQSRHSVRKFKEEEIPQEFIRKALECASKAPTGRNKQPWIFVVIKNKETLKKIAELAPNGKFIEGAAVGILVFGEADWKFTVEDCCAATENLLLALHAYGYGGCWIAGNQMPYTDAVRELANVPETYTLISIVAAGVPDVGGITLAEKIPLEKLVYSEKYQ